MNARVEFRKSAAVVRKRLCGLPSPHDDDQRLNQKLLFIDLVIDNLKERGAITTKMEREMHLALRPISTRCILNRSDLCEDEEKKRRVAMLLLADDLHTSLDEDIAIFYGK